MSRVHKVQCLISTREKGLQEKEKKRKRIRKEKREGREIRKQQRDIICFPV